MADLTAFFAMGGHGGYVWPAYGLAVLVLVVLLVASIRAVRKQERDLETIQSLRPARRRRTSVNQGEQA
ncbi:MAG: heme exporter protein [Rhodospirillaceae bacterium]|nr:MAG: heme exporter protein [Rhodospirillaceae bacterium]TNC93764.1 MAG: heme exporter protein D [Stygiobacter sp.]